MLDLDVVSCTGCKVCAEVCPKQAIEFNFQNGYWYPTIDNEKCVGCGLCERKCEALNFSQSRNSEPNVYALWTKNTEQRLKCTSGGAAYELSKAIIDKGGYVAGVSWDDGFKSAKYILVNDYTGLSQITQTKYFQADTKGIYNSVKALLDEGKTVLFIGSPCTNVALNKYLSKEYENLFNIEYICRGNPSPLLQKKRVEEWEAQHNSKIKIYHAKNKTNGWTDFGNYIAYENGDVEYLHHDVEPFSRLFTKRDLNTRPSCYQCKYRGKNRFSDITIGDFWGITGVSNEDYYNGVSCFLINSDKGQKLFELIKDNVEYKLRTIEDVVLGNPCLLDNPKKREENVDFFKDVEQLSLNELFSKYLQVESKTKNLLKKMRNIVLRAKRVLKCDIIAFFYYNYFCKSIIRDKNSFIIPYRGSRIQIEKSAKLYIEKGQLVLNTLKVKGSKAETIFTMGKKSTVKIKGEARIAYNSCVQVADNATLLWGNSGANTGLALICSNYISIGNDVMFGRNVTVYDSDFHGTDSGKEKKPVIIGNHVWLCKGVTIMKNVTIEDGSIISTDSVVMKDIPNHCMAAGNPARVMQRDVRWTR